MLFHQWVLGRLSAQAVLEKSELVLLEDASLNRSGLGYWVEREDRGAEGPVLS